MVANSASQSTSAPGFRIPLCFTVHVSTVHLTPFAWFSAPALRHALQVDMNAVYSLPHPNIVRLLAVSTGSSVKALVYEFCPKGSVESLLRKCECSAHTGQ